MDSLQQVFMRTLAVVVIMPSLPPLLLISWYYLVWHISVLLSSNCEAAHGHGSMASEMQEAYSPAHHQREWD